MTSLEAVCSSLASVAPLRLAEDWDNVGLLVGDRRSQIEKVMTCLTVTPGVVAEAASTRGGADRHPSSPAIQSTHENHFGFGCR